MLGLLLAAGAAQAAPPETKPSLRHRSAALQCAERKVELKADCYKETGYPGLSCTSQRLTIIDSGSGRELGGQSYKPAPAQPGDSYPIVAEKIDQVVCAETPAKQKIIAVKVSNGGNCPRCEWADVYAWDGSLLGSSRDAGKAAAVGEAVKAAFGGKAGKLGQGDLSDVYADSAPNVSAGAVQAGGEAYAPYGLNCRPVAHDTTTMEKVSASLNQRYAAVWGKDWARRPTPQQRIEPKAMEEIAAIAGCAALLDQSSCTTFYDPEFGGELTAFTDLATKVPVRRQFDDAIAALPSQAARNAAQSCLKRVAKR